MNYKTLEKSSLIQNISSFSVNDYTVDILRIDTIHPIISGNKWFKLRYYLKDCITKECNAIASFGGPYSNHIVALAFAAKEKGLISYGFIRSNSTEPMTPTLMEAKSYGMDLQFLGRTHFKEKKNTILHAPRNKTYFVDEGGYGILGMQGASDILLDYPDSYQYDYIVAAVGTGTMLAGLVNAAKPHQQIIGIPVLKNEGSITEEINFLLPDDKQNQFTLIHDYHFDGYAKKTTALLDFMKQIFVTENLPLDFVYTGKLLYGVKDLVIKNYFKPNAKILVIHSGGLQGNRSL